MRIKFESDGMTWEANPDGTNAMWFNHYSNGWCGDHDALNESDILKESFLIALRKYKLERYNER